MLRRVLVGKIEMKPVVDTGRRGYRFTGAQSVERFLTGIALDTRAMVVAPTGFEPVFTVRHALAVRNHAVASMVARARSAPHAPAWPCRRRPRRLGRRSASRAPRWRC